CLAASRPSYEDMFCLGRHIARDLATCSTQAVAITTIVVGEPEPTSRTPPPPAQTPVVVTLNPTPVAPPSTVPVQTPAPAPVQTPVPTQVPTTGAAPVSPTVSLNTAPPSR
ncbi:hypothetical protein LTR94_031249, partial [Friedmanniomyces endolithicus]